MMPTPEVYPENLPAELIFRPDPVLRLRALAGLPPEPPLLDPEARHYRLLLSETLTLLHQAATHAAQQDQQIAYWRDRARQAQS